MLKVLSRPRPFRALQWHQRGDAPEFEVADPLRRDPQRWGVHSMHGFQLLQPGYWIVIGDSGGPRVYSDGFFHATFELVEEPTS